MYLSGSHFVKEMNDYFMLFPLSLSSEFSQAFSLSKFVNSIKKILLEACGRA